MTAPAAIDEVVRLPDGRAVAVASHGDPAGTPVMLLHGTPASRLGHEFADAPARERGVRILCPDRPGIGGSDATPRTDVAGWTDDLAALADAMGIGTFAVVGYSCGGPFALATGAGLASRVSAVATMAGAGPIEGPDDRVGLSKTDLQLLDLSSRRPWAARLMLRVARAGARASPKRAVASFRKELSEVDQRAVDAEDPRAVMTFFIEALRQGPQGVVDEYRLWGSPWGFALEDVRVPVHLWQGDEDRLVPMAHAEKMAARIPGSELHRLPGEGHVSIQHHFGSILDSVSPAAA